MSQAVLENEASPQARAYEMDNETLEALLEAVEAGDVKEIDALLDPFHAADIADFLEQISDDERIDFIGIWGRNIDGDILSELDESLRLEVITLLPEDVLAEAVRGLDTDDVVDLVEDIDPSQKAALLSVLEDVDRAAVEQSLAYPEYTAGRLMQREVVMAPTHWTVSDAVTFLRSADDLPDRFYDIMIVDPKMQPVGKTPISRLVSAQPETPLAALMDEDFRTIPAMQSQEDVAYAFNQYHMVSAPVVDHQNRLVGMITIDDAMEVLGDEADEDIKLLAGVGDESLTDKVMEITRQRFPWLAVNLLTAVLASFVIALFSETIEAIVALAVLMPIVASMGGNAGTQSLTVAVRALATKDLTGRNALRVVRREVLVGLLNGMIFAVIIGAVGLIWYGDAMLGVVLALAMIANLLVAGLAGILVPLGLDKAGIDPALASGAFVTTVTDVVGFLAFLGLAAMVLL